MKNEYEKKKLALNLSKTSIQLLLGKENNKWQVIGSANPGSNNINEELSVMKSQASALCGKKPVVDVLLPKELILSQTIIVEDNISVEDCKKIIAERCGLNAHELYVATGKSSTNRTLPVAAITVKSIGETRNFVKKKGFLPNRFIGAEKISGFKNPPVFIKDKSKWQGIDFDSTTTLRVIATFSLFLFLGFLFSLGSTIIEYREKTTPHGFLLKIERLVKLKEDLSPVNFKAVKEIKNSVQEYRKPQNEVNLPPQMIEPKITVTKFNFEIFSNKYSFSEKQRTSNRLIRDFSIKQFYQGIKEISFNSLTSTNLIVQKEPRIKEAESLSKNMSLSSSGTTPKYPFVENEIEIAGYTTDLSKETLSLGSNSKVIGLEKVKNILKNFKTAPFKEFRHKNYQKIVIEEVFTDISLSKISIKSNMTRASVLPAIFSFSVKPIIFKANIEATNSKEIMSSTMVNNKFYKTAYQIPDKLETLSLISVNLQISENLQKKLSKKEEIFHDFSTYFLRSPLPFIEKASSNFKTVEKWEENFPYSKPNIIDLIRVIDDPTKSSGALTYVELPPKMPAKVIALKKVNPDSIKYLTIRSKPPSIPKRSSIVGNSTMRNIIELNRTNLIGVFGKRNGRIALIRLSSGGMIRVGVGQKFGEGWRVLSIDLDKIHISNGKRQETLRIPG